MGPGLCITGAPARLRGPYLAIRAPGREVVPFDAQPRTACGPDKRGGPRGARRGLGPCEYCSAVPTPGHFCPNGRAPSPSLWSGTLGITSGRRAAFSVTLGDVHMCLSAYFSAGDMCAQQGHRVRAFWRIGALLCGEAFAKGSSRGGKRSPGAFCCKGALANAQSYASASRASYCAALLCATKVPAPSATSSISPLRVFGAYRRPRSCVRCIWRLVAWLRSHLRVR